MKQLLQKRWNSPTPKWAINIMWVLGLLAAGMGALWIAGQTGVIEFTDSELKWIGIGAIFLGAFTGGGKLTSSNQEQTESTNP